MKVHGSRKIMHGVLVKEKRLSNSSGETFADMRSIVPAADFKFVVFNTFALS